MRFLELLRIFRVIANLPDFGDKESVRQWLLKLCEIASMLTERTPTEADDAVLAFLERSIGDEKLFDPVYSLLLAILGSQDEAGNEYRVTTPPALTAEAEKAGIDPMTILAIVEAVAALVKLIRERRGK